jgi:S-adenosylmethionine hydrolase
VTTRSREAKTGRKGKASRHLPVITLLTDFGSQDYYVGAVKGVIATRNPRAHIIDISHDIPPQNIEAAAFTLFACYQTFPKGAVHLAVVDPGVGSSRRPIIVTAGQYQFVGPDNGIFSYIYEAENRYKVFEITNERYFRKSVSSTFHGRDIFAPVAAVLSKNVRPGRIGQVINDPIRLPPLVVPEDGGEVVEGRIIHIDRFGNCLTNLTRKNLRSGDEANASLLIGRRTIEVFRDHFSENPNDKKLFGVWGSAGFLEIAVRNGSAAVILKAKYGDLVRLTRKRKKGQDSGKSLPLSEV